MIDPLWLLLLPVAAATGWFAARRDVRRVRSPNTEFSLPSAYFKGLNFLLNEQPDKAIEVFIKVLEVDSETVEMHLTLGNLFRRRGEIERATRIHQNLIARPNLSKSQRVQALNELAQDYFKAGLFDRAENLLQELADLPSHAEQALKHLSQIYEQEKEWHNAIKVALRLQQYSDKRLGPVIAQYYCELAEEEMSQQRFNQAREYVRQALEENPGCTRATIQYGDIDYRLGKFERAIATWRQIMTQDPRYLGEVVAKAVDCHHQLADAEGALRFLRDALDACDAPNALLAYIDELQRQQGPEQATEFLSRWLREHPSVRGLRKLIELKGVHESYSEDMKSVQALLLHLVDSEGTYRCRQCGFAGRSMHWQCPGCKGWHTYEPIPEEHRLQHTN